MSNPSPNPNPAQALHLAFARLSIRRHYEAASLILGRAVRHFSDLAYEDRARLWDALAELKAVGATTTIEGDGSRRVVALSALQRL